MLVTATRGAAGRETSPASASIVTRAELERRAVTAVDQALVPIEGVSAYRVRGLADNESGIGMRGFSGRGSGQSRVLVLLDGQPINNGYTGAVNWTALSVGDVDRVEVVRGPFSSLYGGNAMGGVVNVLTRPIDRRSAEVFAQYGSNQTTTASARASVRLWSRLGLGVSYEDQRTDGYPESGGAEDGHRQHGDWRHSGDRYHALSHAHRRCELRRRLARRQQRRARRRSRARRIHVRPAVVRVVSIRPSGH